jgi:hypothetical protein
MIEQIFKQNLFTLLTKFLVIILPFYVLIKVFFEYKLGISNFGFFIKELVIVLLFLCLVWEYFKSKKLPKFDILDYLIFAYFFYWIAITIINWLWLDSIIHGWRYDFLFLWVFLIFRHGKQFLQIKKKKLITIFIYSASISLLLSILVKFRFWEDALLFFWYTDYVSNWVYSWWIPSYHWLENSQIKRFSWILESPNSMWFFLILYSFLFLYLQKKKNEFYVYLLGIFLFILLFITYSRSALLGIIWASGILILVNLKYLFKFHKKIILSILIIFLLFSGIAWILLKENIKNIVLRGSSTSGHFIRMEIWVNRFLEKPFGWWLAESGPWYRNIESHKIETKGKNNTEIRKEKLEKESYYIPESWFIQQLVEWGFIYFMLFISIFSIILKRLYRYKEIFALLVAILIMNVFLHIFEATYLSILLFIIIWLFLNKKNVLK